MPPPRHRQQQRLCSAQRDEDTFAGERTLEAGESARGEVFEDAVAVVLATPSGSDSAFSMRMEFTKVVVGKLFSTKEGKQTQLTIKVRFATRSLNTLPPPSHPRRHADDLPRLAASSHAHMFSGKSHAVCARALVLLRSRDTIHLFTIHRSARHPAQAAAARLFRAAPRGHP
jgi:hypothetical protein